MASFIFLKNEIHQNSTVNTFHVHSDTNKPFYPHWHSNFEIIRVLKNSIFVWLNNMTIVLDEGDCMLIFPGCAHDIGNNTEPADVQIIQFHLPKSILSTSSSYSSLHVLLSVNYANIEKMIIQESSPFSKQVFFLCDELWHEVYGTETPSENIVAGALQMLIGYFLCNSIQWIQHRELHEKFNIIDMCNYIDSLPICEVDLATVSFHMGYSPAYFSSKFKKITGIGFKHYLDHLKMQEARRLLGEGNSVTTVAFSLGFHCVQNFSRTFKRIHKMTPTKMMHPPRNR